MPGSYQDLSDEELDNLTNPDGDDVVLGVDGDMADDDEDEDDDDEEEGDEDDDEDPGAEGDGKGDAAKTPAGEEPAAGDPSKQQPKDEGPGDKNEALRQERERRRNAEAELAKYRQRDAAEATRAKQEEQQARYEELLAEDPDKAAAYLDHLQDVSAREAEVNAGAQAAAVRMDNSEDLAREYLGDAVVDATIARFTELLNDPELGPTINVSAIASAKNPFRAVQRLVERLDGKKGEDEAAFEAEVDRRLAERLGKINPPPKGHRSIGRFTSSAAAPPRTKSVRDMTDAELEAATRRGKRR